MGLQVSSPRIDPIYCSQDFINFQAYIHQALVRLGKTHACTAMPVKHHPAVDPLETRLVKVLNPVSKETEVWPNKKITFSSYQSLLMIGSDTTGTLVVGSYACNNARACISASDSVITNSPTTSNSPSSRPTLRPSSPPSKVSLFSRMHRLDV